MKAMKASARLAQSHNPSASHTRLRRHGVSTIPGFSPRREDGRLERSDDGIEASLHLTAAPWAARMLQ